MFSKTAGPNSTKFEEWLAYTSEAFTRRLFAHISLEAQGEG